MNRTMSNCEYYSFCNPETQPRVLTELAFARYDDLIVNDHDNFIAFIYKCFKDEARECQKFAENEQNEYISIIESFYFILDSMRNDVNRLTVRDYICKPQFDNYSPFYHIPLIYDYDPNENYKRA